MNKDNFITPRKEDFVVYGRIVSASTENVVADTRQIYDEKNSIRQNEINSKFLSGDYTINTKNISQDIWGKIENEYLRLDGGNMNGTIGWRGSNLVTIGEDGIGVSDGYYLVSINASNPDVNGCISVSYDDAKTQINGSNIKLFIKDDESIKQSLILNETGISITGYIDNNPNSVFSVSSDEDEGDTFVHGIGFATFDQNNIGLLSNDGTVGLPITDQEIDDSFNMIFEAI